MKRRYVYLSRRPTRIDGRKVRHGDELILTADDARAIGQVHDLELVEAAPPKTTKRVVEPAVEPEPAQPAAEPREQHEVSQPAEEDTQFLEAARQVFERGDYAEMRAFMNAHYDGPYERGREVIEAWFKERLDGEQ